MGNRTIKGIKPDCYKLNNRYFLDRFKGKNSWFYIIDTKRNILWAEIQYPD